MTHAAIRLHTRLVIFTAVILSSAGAAFAQGRGGAPPATARTTASDPVPRDVVRATEFLLAAYPDLAGRPVHVSVNTNGGRILVTVTDGEAVPGVARPPAREPLVGAELAFSPTGRLESFRAHGVLLERPRNEALAAQLRAHPEWTDVDAEAALQSLGGRSADGGPPGLMVDPRRIATYLGESAAVVGTTRTWRPTNGTVGPFAPEPGWTAEVRSVDDGGRPANYQLSFEPFGGRLRAVTRR